MKRTGQTLLPESGQMARLGYTKISKSVSILVTMKITILSVTLALLAAGCSRKSTESTTEAIATGALPQFNIAAGDLASPATVTTNKAGSVELDINLAGSKTEALQKFSQEHLNQQIEILAGSKVLMRAVIRTPISDGKVAVDFASSDTNAQTVADWLNKK